MQVYSTKSKTEAETVRAGLPDLPKNYTSYIDQTEDETHIVVVDGPGVQRRVSIEVMVRLTAFAEGIKVGKKLED